MLALVPTSLSIAILLLLTEALYVPFAVLRGSQFLFGSDYMLLHIRRITFARDALFGPGHFLPGWYPRELLGAPFTANLQSFPWIPTRIAILGLDPERAFGAGVAIAAALSALFMFLFLRRSGLSDIAAIAGAWTFACSGYFACRVVVGHLPLLEAYPGVPLLLWLADRAMRHSRVRDIAVLAFASACIVVAGHPQIPIYSIATAVLYILYLGKGRTRVNLCLAIASGIGCAAVIWWPMFALIRRSTRVLPLDAPSNDITLPYHRLLALVVPGIDGWPSGAGTDLYLTDPFTGYPDDSYFWDTLGYVGLLPLIAAALLIAARRHLSKRFLFIAILGIAALIFALPLIAPLRQLIPGTLLRSPARLLYLWTFSLAAALGAAVDAVLRWKRHKLALALVAVCLAFHAWDLGSFSRLFIHPISHLQLRIPEFEQLIAREIGDGRVAINRTLALELASRYDDPGGFDSIFLAHPYLKLLALGGLPPRYNEQIINAETFGVFALQATGVHFVITPSNRPDLELVKTAFGHHLYRVPKPALRTADGVYTRPSSDQINIDVAPTHNDPVTILEAYDPGWTATLDGNPAPVVEANGFALAVPVSPGKHQVRLTYQTPGRITGAIVSVLSACLLGILLRLSHSAAASSDPAQWSGTVLRQPAEGG